MNVQVPLQGFGNNSNNDPSQTISDALKNSGVSDVNKNAEGSYDVTDSSGNTINMNEVDLATLILQVLGQRYDILDQQVRDEASEIQEKNVQVENVNAAMDAANTHTSDSDSTDPSDVTFTYTDPTTGETSTENVKDFMTEQGLSGIPDGSKWDKDDWNSAVTTLKNTASSLTSTASEEQTEMNATYNKLQECSQTMATFQSNWHQMMSTIIGKM